MIFKDKDIEAGARELWEWSYLDSVPWDLLDTYTRNVYKQAMIKIMKAMKAPMNLRKK